MYANAPNASAATPPLSPQIPQHHPQVQQHGHPQGMPTAGNGGPHGMYGQTAAAPAAYGHQPATTPGLGTGATFVTGAYQASGDPGIDRMLRLEAALKRFGSPI